MSTTFSLIVKSSEDQKTTNDLVSPTPSAGSPSGGAPDAWGYLQELTEYFGAAAVGSKSLNIIVTDGLTYATGTVTFTADVSNNDTITIGGIVTTFVTGTPTAHQSKCGVTQAATMAALAAHINTSADYIGMVTAVVTSATVVTLTAAYPGLIGNAIRVTKSAASISGVTDPLASGATTNYYAAVSAGI